MSQPTLDKFLKTTPPVAAAKRKSVPVTEVGTSAKKAKPRKPAKKAASEEDSTLHEETATKLAEIIWRETCHRDPCRYGQYIHADYACYGQLEAIENAFKEFVEKFQAQKLTEAFTRMEAIFMALDRCCVFYGIDDGERNEAFSGLLGAAWVTLVKRLRAESLLNDEVLPAYKEVLNLGVKCGDLLNSIADPVSAYPKIFQAIIDDVDPDTIKLDGEASTIDFDFEKNLKNYEHGRLGGTDRDLRIWGDKKKRISYKFKERK